MNVTINKDLLLSALSAAGQAISKGNHSASLSNCMIDVSGETAIISSTDMDISMSIKIPCNSSCDGKFLVDPKKLTGMIKELPDEEITLNINEKFIVKIKSEKVKGKYKIVGMSANDFPVIEKMNDIEYIEIEQSELKNAIEKVIHAAALDQIKPIFNALYFSENNICATDSRRIALYKISSKIENEFILQLKTVNVISKLLSDGFCNIGINGNTIIFDIDNVSIISKIVDGKYPDVKSVLPKEKKLYAKIETELLIKAVRRASVFTREPANKVVFNFNENILKISVETPEVGESVEEISIDSNCNDFTMAMNSKFLFESLRGIDSQVVEFGMTEPANPVVIKNVMDENKYLSVIMPIYLKGE